MDTLIQFPGNIDPEIKGSYRRRNKLATPLIRWWLFVVFICVYLLLFLPNADFPELALVTLIPTSLALWFGLLSLVQSNGARKLYDPITLFNTGLFYYSLKGVALSWGDATPFLSHINMAQIAKIYPSVALLTAAGIIAWNWGYNFAGRRAKDRGTKPQISAGRWRFEYLNPRLGVLFLTLVGALTLYVLIHATGKGMFVFLLESWKRGNLSDTALSGSASVFTSLLLPGVLLLPLASVLWLAILGNNRLRPGLVFWTFALLTLFAVFLVMPRATMIGSLLSMLFVYHYTIRRVSPVSMGIIAVIGLLYVYGMGLWRALAYSAPSIDQVGVLLLERSSLDDLSDFLVSGSIADIRIFVLVANHYGVDLPLELGATLIRVVTQFVPRGLWPAKPIDLGVDLGRLSNPYTISGTPAGFLAEMYINFHFVGVLIGAFLLGVLFKLLYRGLLGTRRPHVMSIVVYAITIPRILLLPSNTISLAFVSWAIPVVAALAAVWLCTVDKTSMREDSQMSP